MPVTIEQARAAKISAKRVLANVPGVVGVGITRVGKDYAIKVNLNAPLPSGTSVPDRIGKVAVTVEIVGDITKRS